MLAFYWTNGCWNGGAMRGVHALEYTYSFRLLSDMSLILGPVEHLLMVVCVHFAVALLACPRVWCILTVQPTPLTLGWLEPFRSSLMTVTSMVEIINVLGFGRADDGSAPNWARVLPVSPVMPNTSLLIDRRACAEELFTMVYEEQCAAETVFKVDLEEGGSVFDGDEPEDRRPGVVCIVATSGSGKTQLVRFMASSGRPSVNEVSEATKNGSYTAWRDRLVIMGVNFNSHFQMTEEETELLAGEFIDFKHLTILRLVYFERADLGPSRRVSFSQYIQAVDFALREGVLNKKLMNREVQQLLIRRAGRGKEDDPLLVVVDEVSKIANTIEKPLQTLQAHVASNSAEYAARDGRVPSVVALIVAGACRVADDGGGSVLLTASESQLLKEGATVVSGRDAPHYLGLVEDPEECIPLCLAALQVLAKNGLYVHSQEIDSTELAKLLRADYAETPRAASARAVELLTPMARSLAYATGGHPRTVVKLSQKLCRLTADDDVSSVLGHVISKDFTRSVQQLWQRATLEERNNFLATLILGEAVDCEDSCFPSLGTVEQTVDISSWDWARRCGLIYGVGDEFVPRVSPIMLRRLLRRASSSSLLFYDCLKLQVDGGQTSSWMEWETLCCAREWAHSIARSLRSSEYSAVTLGSLLGADSSYCGPGSLLREMLVDASHARSGWSRHNLQTLLSWEGTFQENDLLDKVWLLTEGTAGVDAVMFFRCVKCPHDPTLEGKLVMVAMQHKFKNLLGDAKKDKKNLPSAKVVYEGWNNMATAFGPFWECWRERVVNWVLVNMEVQAKFNMDDVANVADPDPACGAATIVTSKTDLPTAFGATIYHNCLSPGVLLKSVVRRY